MTGAAAIITALVLASGAQAAVSPVVGSRDGLLTVQLTHVQAPTVEVLVGGGLASGGRWFGWVPLVQTGPGSWRSVLRAPGFLGVYPLEVRTGHRVVDAGPLVRILPRGYAAEPGFFTPGEVAEWWARSSPRFGRLAAVSTWQTGFFTHRDARFNRLLRVTVRLPSGGKTLTTFISIARVRADGPWRLLEAVPAP